MTAQITITSGLPHPDHYKQRTQALRLLVMAAEAGHYPKAKLADWF